MKRCDVTIKKQMTINTGNYSSIQPSVSITLKDVYIEDAENTYKNLDTITSVLFIKEIERLGEVQDDIQKVGFKKYLQLINVDDMREDLANSIKELSEIPTANSEPLAVTFV